MLIALIQSPIQQQTVTSIENFWWQSEYSDLIMKVRKANKSTLFTSYKSGFEGMQKVDINLKTELDNCLVLEITQDVAQEINEPIFTIRDKDGDGQPDDFQIEFEGKPAILKKDQNGNLTIQKLEGGYSDNKEERFIKLKDLDEHKNIFFLWSIGIGFSINHFLHGNDSVLPRS